MEAALLAAVAEGAGGDAGRGAVEELARALTQNTRTSARALADAADQPAWKEDSVRSWGARVADLLAADPHIAEAVAEAMERHAPGSGKAWYRGDHTDFRGGVFLREVVGVQVVIQNAFTALEASGSTGKTRACWEAVQVLASHGWCLRHPFDPTRADAALEGFSCVGPRTVVWLNEAQHYLAAPQIGERIVAGLRTLLSDADRGPVLVLGTLWPEYWDELTARPSGREGAAHSQVRELSAGRVDGQTIPHDLHDQRQVIPHLRGHDSPPGR
ncbi:MULTISPECIES: hypothetical protein [unclassified Streptomyces]|uniref:hypothetical protein n=1 Tax=unclassified Streptomyces TaxID=2593676 RepID=UPI002367292E|nr:MULTISPECIES: hypothetical protein [unclassified Streptomyces]MDF3143963.1 hypothetical protein [Streptomyces sp. T21Q-yed]WDF35711.1 hypothetical protein PBV52_02270 [Streptomyces sp. T12]